MHWLESAPLWIIGLAILVALVAAEQLAFAARKVMLRGAKVGPSDDGIGFVLSGAIALLGLLIAFTFSEASNRFDIRRLLVVQEANAIGTTYLRIQALDEAPKAVLSQLMVQYVHARQAWFQAGVDPARLAQTQAATVELQNRIWAATLADVRANPTATINPSLLQTTNDMFDLASSSRAALDARLPISILRVLMLYALIAAAMMGHSMARATRPVVVSVALYLALSLAICLILDLDRPRSGTVNVSQAPMDRAIASVESAEAAKAAVALLRPAP